MAERNLRHYERGIRMKKILITALMITALIGSTVRAEQETEQEKEILFRDIPWGTSFTDAKSAFSDFGLWGLAGESYKTKSIDDIILGDYQGIDFEYNDINIIGNTYNGEVDVAGYTTSDISMYFAYIPVDGVLTRTEDDSALYGAQYVFEPKNLAEMSADLISKLSSLYGEPFQTTNDSDMWGNKYEYTYWSGANDTELVLKTTDSTDDSTGFYEDEVTISYVWLKGDELLQQASDTLKAEAIGNESSAYGNGSTNGL